MKMFKNVVAVSILLSGGYAVLVMMGVLHPQPEVERPIPYPHRAAPKTTPKKPAFKDDRFTIIADIPEPAIKRTIVVRLHREVSEKELREICYRVEGKDTRTFKRTFISYYLPGMDLGAGA